MPDIEKDSGLVDGLEEVDGPEMSEQEDETYGPETNADGPNADEPENLEQDSTTSPSPSYTVPDPMSPQGTLNNEHSNVFHENVDIQVTPETRYPVRKNRGIPRKQ